MKSKHFLVKNLSSFQPESLTLVDLFYQEDWFVILLEHSSNFLSERSKIPSTGLAIFYSRFVNNLLLF